MDGFLEFLTILGFGLVAGIRHGIDIDHIAAIGDISSSQKNTYLGLLYCILYALGHGLMVIILGIVLLLIGQSLPGSINILFEKFIGITLIILGIYVLVGLLRKGGDFKIKSKWMLIFNAISFGYHKFLHNFEFTHHHPKFKNEKYGPLTAIGIGIIHGIGAETPTQVSAFLVLLGIGRGIKSIMFLLSFVLGIFISNIVVASFSIFGYVLLRNKKTSGNQKIYMGIGFLTAIFSIFAGILFLRS